MLEIMIIAISNQKQTNVKHIYTHMVIVWKQNKQFALTKMDSRAISPQWELIYNYFSLLMHAHKQYQNTLCVYMYI